MEETLYIRIDDKGNVKIDTEGFSGKVCESTVNQVLVGINATAQESGHTSSYYDDGDNPIEILQQ